MSSLHSYRYVVEFQFDLFWYLTSIIQIVLQMFYITHFAIKKTFPLFCRFICFALSWNWIPSDTTLHHFIRVLFFHLIISILKFAVNFFHRICSFFFFAIHCVWVCVCLAQFYEFMISILHFFSLFSPAPAFILCISRYYVCCFVFVHFRALWSIVLLRASHPTFSAHFNVISFSVAM